MGQVFNPAYIFLNVFGLTLIAKLQAEQYIRKSGINYTIIRPGGLRNDPPTGNVVMEPEVNHFSFVFNFLFIFSHVGWHSMFAPTLHFFRLIHSITRCVGRDRFEVGWDVLFAYLYPQKKKKKPYPS